MMYHPDANAQLLLAREYEARLAQDARLARRGEKVEIEPVVRRRRLVLKRRLRPA
jgi:hypothetical protein